MEKELQKPVFCKISEIMPGKHCYHVYGKVTEVRKTQRRKNNGEGIAQVEGIIADETGCASFRFNGDQAGEVREGAVVAIRNGRSSVIDEHILLEVDRFGKISAEQVSIGAPNLSNNISATAWEKKFSK